LVHPGTQQYCGILSLNTYETRVISICLRCIARLLWPLSPYSDT